MAKREANSGKSRPLEILGISEPEERVYAFLLERRQATAGEIEKAFALTATRTQRLIESMESKGLVSRTPETPRKYVATAPDIALNVMIHRHQKGLEYAQEAISELQGRAGKAVESEAKQILEVISNPNVERRIIDQVLNTTKQEVRALTRLPMLINRLDRPVEDDHRAQREAQKRGVKFRNIVDWSYLSIPGAITHTKADMKAGEEVRVFPELPFKMYLFDRRIAFVPLNLDSTRGPSLLLRSSALLDGIITLFELLWKHANPITISDDDTVIQDKDDSTFPEHARDLVLLLAAGLNDKTAASEMDLSMRTFYRRLEKLMESANARTRFQLGWNLGVSRTKD